MGQRYEISPLPNLEGLAKFETAGEACGESFNVVFLWNESARSPLPNLQGLAKCRVGLFTFAKPARIGKVPSWPIHLCQTSKVWQS
jgi:hypothetical protein